MCKLYVNATLGLYADVRYDQNGNTESLVGMFDCLDVDTDERGLPILPNFQLVSRICILGSENNQDNILNRQAKLVFKVRLTKCDSNPNNQLGKDLTEFILDLSDAKVRQSVCMACFPYLNFTQITNVSSLKLEPGSGKYVLKLLIAEVNESHELVDDDFTVQSMYSLTVGIRKN